MTPKFIYIESYGCSANQNNTEIMKGLILQSGLQLTDSIEIADIIIINTCIVKGPTENKIKRRIQDLQKLNKPIIVAGCMPEVRKLQANNIYLLGIHHIKEIVKLIKAIYEARYEQGNFLSEKDEVKLCMPKISQNRKIGITQISEGCIGDCNFCLTRYAKGKLFSYPEEQIIKQIKQDIESGCKEIWLTSQDNAAYSLDEGKRKLPELLRKILNLKGNFKVRLGMMNPNNVLPILDELVEIYKNDKMYKLLHLPLQSGSNKILKLMNRKYTVEQFLNIIEKFQEQMQITIATDIITAYPEETEEDFLATLSLIEKIKPDIMNISKYWQMKGTKAAEMKQIDVKIASKRAAEVQKLHLKLALENNKKCIGWQGKVLVNQKVTKTNFLARNSAYQLIIINSEKEIYGKIVNIKVEKAFPHYLIGEVL